jgi:hypothetical protein
MRGEVVEAAHGVPDLQPRAGISHQQHLLARYGVLVVGRAQARARARGVRIVDALALAHGIEGQHQVAQLHQALAASLVGIGGLPVEGVAHLEEDTRIRRLTRRGHIEVSRNVELRPALVDDFFDAVAGALEGSEGAGVERRALGHPAGEPPKRLPDPLLPFGHRGRRSELGDLAVPQLVGFLGEVAEEVREAARVIAIGDAGESGLGPRRPHGHGGRCGQCQKLAPGEGHLLREKLPGKHERTRRALWLGPC